MSQAPSLRGRWRRLKLGLPTVLGLKPRGWFIPHRYAPLLPPPGAQPPYPAIERLFEEATATFTGVLDVVDAHAAQLESVKSLFDQSWFPSLDAAVAYALVRERKPQHIIEVGSGHSTRVLSKAMGGLGEIIAVDPAPRADIIDLPGVRVVNSTLQAAPADLFNVLKAGDALFIDSSHILMPGSDVDILLNRVLPKAPAGTLVHIHDIFLPFDYPAIWGWRAYNEQQGIVALLTSGAYRPLFSSAWAERRLAERLATSVVARLPRPDDALPASLWLEKALMFGRLRGWLFGGSGAERLPERVREAIRLQQQQSEILIGWAELVLVGLLAVAYETTSMATGVVQEDYSFETHVFILYGVFSLVRLVLAYRRALPEWLLYVSVIADMALLMGLIYSFHYKYAQTAVFYLKAPTLLYVFLFIALRALRFEARFVIFAGLTAAAGWLVLIFYALGGRGGPPNETTDFVEYMTSNAFLIQAEAEKLLAILLTTAVLAIAISRARHLLVRSVSEGVAARDLARFFDPGVADRIRSAAMSIRPGEGELRDVAILTVDLRGFTRLSVELEPGDVMKLLQDYQGRVCPLIAANGGSIDKFLGDGILASFGAVVPSQTAAADALRAADGVLAAADRWADERRAAGLSPLSVGLAVASGRVVFGAVGDAERLEFTVIGDAVNFAAKLEKHNKDEKTRALVDARTYQLAEQQGYVAPAPRERRPARPVGGVSEPVDIVVLAK